MNKRQGQSGNSVIAAISQTERNDRVRADQFENECFALSEWTQTPGSVPSATLSSDTELWGYRLIRQRPYYWQDKKKLLVRMMRTTNITLFKKKSPSYTAVVIPGENRCWMTCYGPVGIYLFDGSECARIGAVPEKTGGLTALGLVRYATPQQPVICGFIPGHTLLIVTSGIVSSSPIAKIRQWLASAGNSPEQLRSCADMIVHEGLLHTGRDNAAIILKRPVVSD